MIRLYVRGSSTLRLHQSSPAQEHGAENGIPEVANRMMLRKPWHTPNHKVTKVTVMVCFPPSPGLAFAQLELE